MTDNEYLGTLAKSLEEMRKRVMIIAVRRDDEEEQSHCINITTILTNAIRKVQNQLGQISEVYDSE